MADNIVERLRYQMWLYPSEGETADAHYLAADALAEIERLRTAGDKLARVVAIDVIGQMFSPTIIHTQFASAALQRWKEARRG